MPGGTGKDDCQSYVIRRVGSIEDLKRAFEVLGAQFTPPIAAEDRVFQDLVDHYPQDRRLMLVAEQDGQIAGGALGFGSTLRILALKPEARGKGLGRRLIQTYEVAAMRHGVRTISLGAVEQQKGFYERMGYRGKSSMHKELPLPGRVLELRLRNLEALLGDLEAGQVVRTDVTGKLPPLF
jgi:predicted N-acetyltransferase YhbS